MKKLFLNVSVFLIVFVNCSNFIFERTLSIEECRFRTDLQSDKVKGKVLVDTTFIDFRGIEAKRKQKKIYLRELIDIMDTTSYIINTRRWNEGILVMDRIKGDIPFEHYEKYSRFVLSKLLPKSERINLERPYTYDTIDGCKIESLSNKLNNRGFYRVRLDVFRKKE